MRLDSATEFDFQLCLRGDCLQSLQILRLRGLCPVKVNDVKPFHPNGLKILCHVDGVRRINFLAAVVSAGKPYAFTANEVDSRYYSELQHIRKKFSRIFSPTGPLFSGWN